MFPTKMKFNFPLTDGAFGTLSASAHSHSGKISHAVISSCYYMLFSFFSASPIGCSCAVLNLLSLFCIIQLCCYESDISFRLRLH